MIGTTPEPSNATGVQLVDVDGDGADPAVIASGHHVGLIDISWGLLTSTTGPGSFVFAFDGLEGVGIDNPDMLPLGRWVFESSGDWSVSLTFDVAWGAIGWVQAAPLAPVPAP